jgi:hypothetical protein
MSLRRSLLCTYRILLQLYPSAFRRRFAPEMMELAEMADPGEWPLIFGDTSVAIVRCWLEPSASSTAMPEPNAYLGLGGFTLSFSKLLPGFVLSIAIILGLYYGGSLNYIDLPKCHAIAAESISR